MLKLSAGRTAVKYDCEDLQVLLKSLSLFGPDEQNQERNILRQL